MGALRKCELTPGGWFKERVSDWKPDEALAFELFECTLPVRRLTHSYTLTRDGGGTLVRQRMEYELKFGAVGRLLDALMVRKKWDAGVKSFFAGLKRYVETGRVRSRWLSSATGGYAPPWWRANHPPALRGERALDSGSRLAS